MTSGHMPAPLTWLHIGDLHLKGRTDPHGRNLQQIVAHAAALPAGSLDFVLLPGDNADNGTPAQYRLVRDGLAPLELPVHILPGDHDIEPGNLDAFHAVLGARKLPYAGTVRGHRCLFLDVVSSGTGGPDFRLGQAQADWVEQETDAAAGQDVAIFMHTYPADLREGAERIGAVLSRPHVTCVDMGHTHYNELSNDGGTIFMAARSTGQIEEGPPGFAIATVDGGCVAWRFKALDQPWPFVLITQPADMRFSTVRSRAAESLTVRARVLGDAPILAVTLHADDGPLQALQPVAGQPGMFEVRLDAPARRITVQATDAASRTDRDRIDPAPDGFQPPETAADGSDNDSIEAWPEKGIVGGQLGRTGMDTDGERDHDASMGDMGHRGPGHRRRHHAPVRMAGVHLGRRRGHPARPVRPAPGRGRAVRGG